MLLLYLKQFIIATMTKHLLSLLFFLFYTQLFSQVNADFVIIEKPQNLVIYNKYKQAISNNEKQLFVPYKPFQIKKSSGLFSDGVRGYMEIETNNLSYFIVKEAGGNYYNQSKSGEWAYYKNKRTYYDSIMVLDDNKLTFDDLAHKKEYFLKKGDILIRVFEDNERFYCKNSKNNAYGKVNLSGKNSEFYKILRSKKSNSNNTLTTELKAKILAKFNDSNIILKRLYAFFNTENNKNLPVPVWKIKTTNNSIEAVLSSSAKNFANSNKYLVNQLENILLGTNLQVTTSANKIVIGH